MVQYVLMVASLGIAGWMVWQALDHDRGHDHGDDADAHGTDEPAGIAAGEKETDATDAADAS
jgi:hypothetical protein